MNIEDENPFQNRPINFLRSHHLPESPIVPSGDIGPTESTPTQKPYRFYFLLIVFILVLGSCSYRNFTLSQLPTDPTAYDAITLKPKRVGFLQTVKNFIFHSGNVLAGESNDRINILVMGMGGPGHDGPYLTDTNIIASIKPSIKEVALTSVPRDLGTNIPGHGIYKINAADAFGEAATPGEGGEFARQVFAKTFDLDIPYYVRVDFKAFVDLIDAVGGITLSIPKSFTDTQFPGPNFSFQTVTFTAGAEHMNGERALTYARSRHGNNGEGSDFARARRQQQVISALKEKLLSFGTYTNPVKIQKIISSLAEHVSTNLDFGQIMYLAVLAKETDSEIKTLVLDNSVEGFLNSIINENGAFMLVPKSGNFAMINDAIKNIFSDNAQIAQNTDTIASVPANKPTFPSAHIELQNGTWHLGLASRWQLKLQDKGFTVAAIGNSYKRPLDKTAIYVINAGVEKEIINALAKEISVEPTTILPDWLSENYDNTSTPNSEMGLKYKPETDVLVILGENASE